MLNGHEFTVKGDATLGEEGSQFTACWDSHHPCHFVVGDLQLHDILNHRGTRISGTSVVVVLLNVGPSGCKVNIATKGHDHRDVSTVRNRGIQQTNGDTAAVWPWVGLGDNDHPLTWLNTAGPLERASVHGAVDVNCIALNTRNGVEDNARIHEASCIELVGGRTEDIHQTGGYFDVRGIWTVVNRVSGLVFRFVVNGLKAFLLNTDVVDITNGDKDAPDTLIIGHHGLRERVVVTLNGDGHLRQSLTKAWCAVVVKVPVDLSTNLHLKGSVNGLQNQTVVHRSARVERLCTGVHEPRLGADGSVQVKAPGTGHQQLS